LIFLYVLIGGMLVPLKPGISQLSPSTSKAGASVTMNISGYNTHFGGKGERYFLKLDSSKFIEAKTKTVSSANNAQAVFDIPVIEMDSDEGSVPLSLISYNDTDGAFVAPNAIFITKADSVPDITSDWQDWTKVSFDSEGQFGFPYRSVLHETIRNTFFHIALWFAMFALLIVGLVYAIKYLIKKRFEDDIKSAAYNKVAILYGILGLLTGSIWAKFTWNSFWTDDVKLNMTAVAMLIYLAYVVLRASVSDQDRRANMSASYSIFAFVALVPLIFVIPRIYDSLHPGNGGNPALGGEDLDNTLRMFFYPSIIALILIGLWVSQLIIRYENIKISFFTKKVKHFR
jgi:heme exporter protein C